MVFNEVSGHQNAEEKVPMQKDSIFRIYSMTKSIVSVALMILFERSYFQLDDPVSRYIPCFADMKVVVGGKYPDFEVEPARRPITIKHLLTHTAGLTYRFNPDKHDVYKFYQDQDIQFEPMDKIRENVTNKDFVEKLAKAPLLFHPGESWAYSNATDVLGYLVEVLSGEPLDVFLRREVFEPLGMVDTGFVVPEDKWSRFCACYIYSAMSSFGTLHQTGFQTATGYKRLPYDDVFRKHPGILSGGGGLVGTAGDYSRFCQMLLRKGELDGKRILGKMTVEYMLENHMDKGDFSQMGVPSFMNVDRRGMGFGLGFCLILDPYISSCLRSKGEAFWGGMASTAFWIDPKEDISVVFMTQLVPSSSYDFRRELHSLINQAVVD